VPGDNGTEIHYERVEWNYGPAPTSAVRGHKAKSKIKNAVLHRYANMIGQLAKLHTS
jgi:hypothetical protein